MRALLAPWNSLEEGVATTPVKGPRPSSAPSARRGGRAARWGTFSPTSEAEFSRSRREEALQREEAEQQARARRLPTEAEDVQARRRRRGPLPWSHAPGPCHCPHCHRHRLRCATIVATAALLCRRRLRGRWWAS